MKVFLFSLFHYSLFIFFLLLSLYKYLIFFLSLSRIYTNPLKSHFTTKNEGWGFKED